MRRWLACVLTAAALAYQAPALAQTRLFSDDAPIAFTLTGPIPTLVHTASTSIKPFAATLTLTEGAGAPQTFPIKMQARGYSRRVGDYCRFPPILLRFDKAQVKGTLFAHQKKLKLVTYCRPEPDYNQHIVLEYLAYRLGNVVTPMSFRVRGAEVTYRSSDGDRGMTRFGFLIEDINDVADRNDRDMLQAASHQVSRSRLDLRATARAALFEYMIGNLDWEFMAGTPGLTCCHNSRFIAARGANAATASDVVPVPYDYDLSGLVDPPYGTPPEGFPIETLTERYYHGYCVTNPVMGEVIDEYRGHRAAMMALIEGEPHLNATYRAKAERFLDGFFAVLDDPGKVQREITQRCR